MIEKGRLHGVMTKALDYSLEALQSLLDKYFWERHETSYPPAMD